MTPARICRFVALWTRLATAIVVGAPAGAADDCADLLVRQQRINVGSGVYSERVVVAVPVTIDIPIALDPGHYGACLERSHPERGDAIRAWVEHATACRRDSLAAIRLGRAGTAARIGTRVDEAAYHACLAGGPVVEVEIEP